MEVYSYYILLSFFSIHLLHQQVFLLLILSLSPFLSYLYYQASVFCPTEGFFNQWIGCHGKTVYSYVEQKYWNVQLFGYYSWNHVFSLCIWVIDVDTWFSNCFTNNCDFHLMFMENAYFNTISSSLSSFNINSLYLSSTCKCSDYHSNGN